VVATGGKCRAQPSVEAALPSISDLTEKLSFLIDSTVAEKADIGRAIGQVLAREWADLVQEHTKMTQEPSILAE
jgi:hypothetical protein